MENIIDTLAQRLRGSGKRVIFVECTDERILKTAERLAKNEVCTPVFLGDPQQISDAAAQHGCSLEGIAILDATSDELREQTAERYAAAVPSISAKRALKKSTMPLQHAAMLVKLGDADCLAAGVVHSTGKVIVAAQQFIGMAEGIATPSSLGYLDLDRPVTGDRRWVGITDCAVNTNPDATALADIVTASAKSYRNVFGVEPRIAMLSYSTCGSGDGPSVDNVRSALELVHQREPQLVVDGEFQLEVALVPQLAERKLKGRASEVAGRADILVFPCLDAGNIAVKCMQVFGDATAAGPVLQGFSHPVTDFSRSAKADDVYANVVICLSQGGEA